MKYTYYLLIVIGFFSIEYVRGQVPTVTTTTASSILSTSATSGGNVTSIGGSAVTARGVCWGTSVDPTIANSISTDGTGAGAFTSSVVGLLPSTLYHYRAYATNTDGTSYGSDLTFTTSALPTTTEEWNQILKVVASDRAASDNYGYNVSISGSYAVVGAPFQDLDVAGANSMSNAGAAYILLQTNGVWAQVQKIVSSDRAINDNFGYRVAIDGNYIVIGAWAEDEDANGANTLGNAGSAYVFKNNSGTWSQIKKIVNSDRRTADNFGVAVSISGDYVVVGSHLQDYNAVNTTSVISGGAVYIYQNNSDTWTQMQKIVPVDRSWQDYFGLSVSIDGDYIVVGARQEGTEPYLTSKTLPYYGADSVTKITNQGAAYIFKNISGIWTEMQKLVAPIRNTTDLFGYVVSIDNDIVSISSPQEDEDASELNTLTDAGAVYVFQNYSDTWRFTQKIVASDRATTDLFGRDVCVSGTHIVIGAFQEDEDASGVNALTNAGSAYFYEKVNEAWVQTKKVAASDRAVDDNFGYRVAVNGNNAIITSYQEDDDVAGANALSAAGSIYTISLIPQVSSVGVPTNSTYYTTQNLDFTVNFTHPITVSGTPRITLTIGSSTVYANYLSGTGTSALIFRYTVQGLDQDLDGISIVTLGLNSGTLTNNSFNAIINLYNVGSTSLVLVDIVVVPTVSTTTASSVANNTASSGGNVTSDGNGSVTARGVCWSTSANPTIADSKTTDGTGTGSFTSSLTGLSAGTLYHYRAYATNSAGTSYGSDLTFTTTSISNTAPTASNNTINAIQNTNFVFATSYFNYTDADNDVISLIQITALPTLGTLYNDADLDNVVDGGETVALNGTVSKANIDVGQLKFQAVTDAIGTAYTTFGFKVNDGTVYSTSAYTMTINVLYPTSSATGTWVTAGIWNTSAVPSSAQNVRILNTHNVTISANTTTNDFKLDNGATLTVSGTAVLTINGDLYDSGGSFSIASGASVVVNGNIKNNSGATKLVTSGTNGLLIKGNVNVGQ